MKTSATCILLSSVLFAFVSNLQAQNNLMDMMNVQGWKGHLKIESYTKIVDEGITTETRQTIEGDVMMMAAKSPSGMYFAWPAMFDTSRHWHATVTAQVKETAACGGQGMPAQETVNCSTSTSGRFRLTISIQGGKLTISPFQAQGLEIPLPCTGTRCLEKVSNLSIVIQFPESGQLPLPAQGKHLKGTQTKDESGNESGVTNYVAYTWDFVPAT